MHWRLQEKKREKKRAKTAMLIDQDMREKEKEKIRQRDEKRAKTAAILSRRKRKKSEQQKEQKEVQHRKNLILLEEDDLNDDISESTGHTPTSRPQRTHYRVHTPIPYPTMEQQKDFLPLNSSTTSLYNLYDGEPNTPSSNLISPGPHTMLDRADVSTAPAFRSKLDLMQKRSRRREKRIVEKAKRLHPTLSRQRPNTSNVARFDQPFRVKTLYKIDNVVGDVPLDAQQSVELRWRIDLINQSVLSMYYPNAALPSPPSSPLSRQSSPNCIPLEKLKLQKKTRRKKARSRRGTSDDDPVKNARKFVSMVKKRAEEKFLKAHPKAKELREQWKNRMRDGNTQFHER